jgi:hypothetical protein
MLIRNNKLARRYLGNGIVDGVDFQILRQSIWPVVIVGDEEMGLQYMKLENHRNE